MSPWKKLTVDKNGQVIASEDLDDGINIDRNVDVTPPQLCRKSYI